MGGFSSKIRRALPARTVKEGELVNPLPHPVSRFRPTAREKKDNDIERDGKDPHLLNNLNRIGQVNIRAVSDARMAQLGRISDMYRTRDLAEQQASSSRPVRNRLFGESLSNLLDERKLVSSPSELERLAARYTIDPPVLDSLARFVNTPSIGERTIVRTVGKDGQEKITMQAVWTEPTGKVHSTQRI